MRPFLRPCLALFALLPVSLAITGCSLQGTPVPGSVSSAATITGQIKGGQQPVSGATVQLYAVNSTLARGLSTPLLTTPATTNASGQFSFTNPTCASAETLVYLTATGGNPGLGGTVNNADLAEMVLLGRCGDLASLSYVNVNELTTVAAVEAVAPFMADYAHVGNDAANPTGLTGAFAGAAALVSLATGQFQTAATGVTQPTALYNTLANIIAACINTTGGSANGTACGTLLQNAGTGNATETIGALQGIVGSPAKNVATLYGLTNAQSPYQTGLATAPTDFTASISFALSTSSFGPQARLLAIDSAQHVWISTPNQTASSTWTTGPITVYDNNGGLLFTIQPGTGGLYLPVQLAADPFGNMWTLNSNASVSKFDGSGNALSPTGGFPVPFNFSTSVYSNTSYPHELGLNYMSIDRSGNLWGIGSGSTSNCYIELNNAGTLITPSGNFCSIAANSLTAAVTTEDTGNAWLVGTNSVARVNPAGNLIATGVHSNGCFGVDISNAVTVENSVQNLFWDPVNQQVWGVGNINAGVLHSDGSQLFCDAGGANMPVIPINSGGAVFVASAALDGAGTLWFTTSGSQSATAISSLNAISATGTLVTPFNVSAGVYGLSYTTANVVGENANLEETLAVDAYGNLWYVSANTSLVKVPGLAAPKNHQ